MRPLNLIFSLMICLLPFAANAEVTANNKTTMVNGAMVMPKIGNQVCNIYGTYKNQASSVKQIGAYEGCSTDMISAKTGLSFVGFRLEPMTGPSITPINKTFGKKTYCFYLTNTSSSSYFIPAASQSELEGFFKNMPAGVSKIDCAQPETVSVQDRCGGVLVNSPQQPYTDGFQALPMGRAGIDKRVLYAVDANNKVLRIVYAIATSKGWAISFNQACPDPNQTVHAGGAAVAPAGGFNRNNVSGAAAYAPITDGALVRNIRG